MAHSLPTYRNVAPSPRLSHARHTAATPRASESGHADCALLGPMTDVPFPAAGAARPRRLPEWTLNSLVALCGLALALGLSELLVRLVAPQELIIKRPDVWRPADTLGWFHWPNVTTTIITGDRTVRFITDGAVAGIDGRVDVGPVEP